MLQLLPQAHTPAPAKAVSNGREATRVPLVWIPTGDAVYRDDPDVWDEWDRLKAGLDRNTPDGRAAALAGM